MTSTSRTSSHSSAAKRTSASKRDNDNDSKNDNDQRSGLRNLPKQNNRPRSSYGNHATHPKRHFADFRKKPTQQKLGRADANAGAASVTQPTDVRRSYRAQTQRAAQVPQTSASALFAYQPPAATRYQPPTFRYEPIPQSLRPVIVINMEDPTAGQRPEPPPPPRVFRVAPAQPGGPPTVRLERPHNTTVTVITAGQ